MADIRKKNKKQELLPVTSLKYQVKHTESMPNIVNELSWTYNSDQFDNLLGFKVYKAILPKSIIKKNVIVTQKALEKVSFNRNFTSRSNVLYDKSLFSQNSKVKIENSNSNKSDKVESSLSNYSYKSISIIPKNKNNQKYSFLDKNVKFGESYIYYVSAVTDLLKETAPTPIIANIEFVNHPPAPTFFRTSEIDAGILLQFGNSNREFISEYVILKREDSEKDFQVLAVVDADSNFQYFTDTKIFPKRNYIYKVFSRNIWGSYSLESPEQTISFMYTSVSKNTEFRPSVIVDQNDDNVKILIKNERPDKVSSVRIERRDDWKFDKFFEIKSFDGFPTPSNIFFSKDQIIEHVDKTTRKDRAYSYRITAFNKSGLPVSHFVTSPIMVGDKSSNLNIQAPKFSSPRFSSLNVEVSNKNQSPVYVKCSWKIAGSWSYLIIDNGVKKQRVDNVHSTIFLGGFEPGQKYELNVQLFDIQNVKVQEYKNIIVNT